MTAKPPCWADISLWACSCPASVDDNVCCRCAQVHVGHTLVDWIARCSGAAVRLQTGTADASRDDGGVFNVVTQMVRETGANDHAPHPVAGYQTLRSCRARERVSLGVSDALMLTSLCNVSADEAWDESWEAKEAPYKVGSMELLNAVRGPCKDRGIRCTDINGTGDMILFERA